MNISNNLVILRHKGKIVTTLAGSPFFTTPTSLFPERFIPAGYEHRPDLISNLFFDSSQNWTYVMAINGLSDPFESLNVGDRISLPS